MLHIISLGAGVQSSTMALMAAAGEITPMPDAAIFADTQSEPESVYRHLKWLMEPGVLPFPVHVVTQGDLANDSLQLRRSGRSGRVYHRTLLPLFIKNPDGSKGILMRKCTAEYKVRQIVKKTRELAGPKILREDVTQWIGISTDEAHRMKPSGEDWIEHRWPLIEAGMSRDDCIEWMFDHGYPKPPKSACVFCPYHSDAEWMRLRDEEPEAFAAAVEWESKAQVACSLEEVTKGTPFLHSSLVPLEEVVFSGDRQADLMGQECEGLCGV